MCTLGATLGRARLQRLGAADLAAVRGHRGVVRHVLRLERADLEAAPRQRARQPGDDQDLPTSEPVPWNMSALAVIAPAPAQNSMPGCAFTPAAK